MPARVANQSNDVEHACLFVAALALVTVALQSGGR
jgi:hypothetical protein